jgi:hypothetical protein
VALCSPRFIHTNSFTSELIIPGYRASNVVEETATQQTLTLFGSSGNSNFKEDAFAVKKQVGNEADGDEG